MKTKHTSGEWKCIPAFIPTDTTTITSMSSGSYNVGIDGKVTISQEEGEANALLIAAAPDLLQALQNLLQWANIKDGSPSQGLRDECISVIKKATE